MSFRRSFLLLAALSAATTPAVPECVEVSQRQAFREATLVFRGKVVRVEEVIRDEPIDVGPGKVPLMPSRSDGLRMATFAVDRVWKGPPTDTIRVFAFARPVEGNGYEFLFGAEYVVYTLGDVSREWEPLRQLSNGAPVYEIGECRLRVRTDVARESQILGRGKAPQRVPPRTSP